MVKYIVKVEFIYVIYLIYLNFQGFIIYMGYSVTYDATIENTGICRIA